MIDELAQELYESISGLWIIDGHNHTPPEAERLAADVDAVFVFENPVIMWDLKAAGMPEGRLSAMMDRRFSLEERWEILNEYLPYIRNTSFTRSALLGIRELYGFDEVTADNYRELSEVMRAANKPGIYRRVFHDHCRIAVALTQVQSSAWRRLREPRNFRIPQIWETHLNIAFGLGAFTIIEEELGRSVSSFDAYLEAVSGVLRLFQGRGVVGVKLYKPTIQSCPRDSEVAPLFDRVIRFRDRTAAGAVPLTVSERTALRDSVTHAIIRTAGELGLTVLQHGGYTGAAREIDYRTIDPSNLIPVFMQYPHVRFEVYHAGMPWVRETGMLAKAFPNVWLNLCWTHSISRQMARSALDEWLDLVPANKIIGFGGDNTIWIEWCLGELVQARENISAVLARRVHEGLLTQEQALDLARMMLYDNPKNLHRLDCQSPDDYLYE